MLLVLLCVDGGPLFCCEMGEPIITSTWGPSFGLGFSLSCFGELSGERYQAVVFSSSLSASNPDSILERISALSEWVRILERLGKFVSVFRNPRALGLDTDG